jgi:hypothetical protein
MAMTLRLTRNRHASLIAAIVSGLLVASCAAPYQPLKRHYGYTERQVGLEEYEVSFLGNANSSYERVLDFALLRSAEIAIQHHADSFVVLDVVNLSDAQKYRPSSQPFWSASPYLATSGAIPLPAPELSGTTDRRYVMMAPSEEQIFYRPGTRLKITLSANAAAHRFAYSAVDLRTTLRAKYHMD